MANYLKTFNDGIRDLVATHELSSEEAAHIRDVGADLFEALGDYEARQILKADQEEREITNVWHKY